ncbi:MAG: glycosyltransferase [Aeoliella sp.]
MTPTLTVVLPVHNAEASLRRHVTDVLEMAGELTDGFRVLIVDDGSSDDTFDLAVELSTRYPQVDVLRNARQRGLGPTLRSVRSEVSSDVVVVHDGTSPMDANQIRRLWTERQFRTAATMHPASARGEVSIDDLKLATTTHTAMAAAHSQLLGFQLLAVEHVSSTSGQLTRRESPKQQGVGVIPPLPRPNFMGALANFALGE